MYLLIFAIKTAEWPYKSKFVHAFKSFSSPIN